MIRKLFVVFALFALCLPILAACGGTGAASGGTIPASASCNGKQKQVSGAVTTINWWVNWSIPGLLKSAQDYNCAHPNVAVIITVYPNMGDDSQGKLLAAVAGHRAPDLVLSYDDVLATWAGKGEIQSLDSQVSAAGIKGSDYSPNAWDSVNWQGHVYGIPIDWDPDTLLWYNKQVFKAAGLDPNAPPTTWQQIQDDAAKIDLVQNGKIQRLGLVPWVGWSFNFVEYAHLFNAGLQDGSTKTVTLNTSGMQQALQFEQSVAQKFGGASKINAFASPANASGTAADALLAGRVGMEFIGDWELANQAVIGTSKFQDTLGVAAVPAALAGTPSYLCHSGWAFMIPHGSKNADATMQFVQWMQQGPNFVKYMGTPLGWIPAMLSTRQESLYQDPTWQAIMAANQKNGEGYWLPPSPVLTPYYQALTTAESEVINLKKSPADALSEANGVAQQALQDALNNGGYGS